MKKLKQRNFNNAINSNNMGDNKKAIKDMIKVIMEHFKFKKGVDYDLRDQSLGIRQAKDVSGIMLITLKENFPQFSFYWETPRVLKWF